MAKMSEKHRRRKYYHNPHKRRRLKKRVFYVLVTAILCVILAALINIETSNVFAVISKVTVFIIAGGLFVCVFFLIMYQMTIGRRH